MTASQIIAASAARTATTNFEIESNNMTAAQFLIVTSAGASGTDTLTVSVEGYDPASGNWYQLATTAAITANTSTLLEVSADINSFLPRKYRVVATKNNATSITYSIGAQLANV